MHNCHQFHHFLQTYQKSSDVQALREAIVPDLVEAWRLKETDVLLELLSDSAHLLPPSLKVLLGCCVKQMIRGVLLRFHPELVNTTAHVTESNHISRLDNGDLGLVAVDEDCPGSLVELGKVFFGRIGGVASVWAEQSFVSGIDSGLMSSGVNGGVSKRALPLLDVLLNVV